jgi:hypothetical protein
MSLSLVKFLAQGTHAVGLSIDATVPRDQSPIEIDARRSVDSEPETMRVLIGVTVLSERSVLGR